MGLHGTLRDPVLSGWRGCSGAIEPDEFARGLPALPHRAPIWPDSGHNKSGRARVPVSVVSADVGFETGLQQLGRLLAARPGL